MAFSPFSPIRAKNASRALSDSSMASRVTRAVSTPAALILFAQCDLYSCGRAPVGRDLSSCGRAPFGRDLSSRGHAPVGRDNGPLRALFGKPLALDSGGVTLLSAAGEALSPSFAPDGDGFTEKSWWVKTLALAGAGGR